MATIYDYNKIIKILNRLRKLLTFSKGFIYVMLEENGKNIRSSHVRCSTKKIVLKIFAKLTGRYLCQSLFFVKVAGLRPALNFIKKEALAQLFFHEICENLRNTHFEKHLRTIASGDREKYRNSQLTVLVKSAIFKT